MKGSNAMLNICAGALLKRVERMDKSAKGRSAKGQKKIRNLEKKYKIEPLEKLDNLIDGLNDGSRILRTSASGYVWK